MEGKQIGSIPRDGSGEGAGWAGDDVVGPPKGSIKTCVQQFDVLFGDGGDGTVVDSMSDPAWLGEQFDAHRSRLRMVAYRILGSISEADDAVQGAWLRLSRSDSAAINNLGGWLTTAVAREALDLLRRRLRRREQPLEGHVPDPIVNPIDPHDPEHAAVTADSVGLALLVVLDTLTPAERVAFVLHDVFAVPFENIAPIIDQSIESTRQLASRARRRVQSTESAPDVDPLRQREIVDAFFSAAREGDFDGLVAVLHPEVVLRSDGGIEATRLVRGADAVAKGALMFSDPDRHLQFVLVNGSPGVVVRTPDGLPAAIMEFTVRGDKIVSIASLTDPKRLPGIALPNLKLG